MLSRSGPALYTETRQMEPRSVRAPCWRLVGTALLLGLGPTASPGAGEIRPTQLATRSGGIEASAVTESWVNTLAAIEAGEQVCKRDTGALPTVPDQQNQDTHSLPAGTREEKPLPQAASLMGVTRAV